MPRPKSSAVGKSNAKKSPKVANKEKVAGNEASIITDIVNGGLPSTVEDDLEVQIVEKVSPEKEEKISNKDRKRLRSLDDAKTENDQETKITRGKEKNIETVVSEKDIDKETEPAQAERTEEGIFAKLVDAIEENTDGAAKEPQQARGPSEKRATDAFVLQIPERRVPPMVRVKAPTEADVHQRNAHHGDNFGGRGRGSHRGRGSFAPRRGGFVPRGSYNQPICPPGMEFMPYMPLHPQGPDPNFYPFPPGYPTPEGHWPHHPQYGYPADGFVDPAWYYARQDHASRGMGSGQPNFNRYGTGRGRDDSSRGKNSFNPRRGGY